MIVYIVFGNDTFEQESGDFQLTIASTAILAQMFAENLIKERGYSCGFNEITVTECHVDSDGSKNKALLSYNEYKGKWDREDHRDDTTTDLIYW